MSKLVQIKLLHTLIWLIEVVAILYLLYTGVLGVFNVVVIISFVLVIIETIILIIYKWRCPLTIVASRLTKDTSIGFDIYLPSWLAKYNKTIFSILFGAALVAHLIRLFS